MNERAEIRLAMWSGPRNISTAMMRSFENRSDTVVVDEPLYGPYLAMTGLDHPLADAVIAQQGPDWRVSIDALRRPLPSGVALQYEKHMTHHMLPGIGREWLDDVEHCFLIRDPKQVIASYRDRRSTVTLDDLGFKQQAEIFDRVAQRRGSAPAVLDAADVLTNPSATLQMLCTVVGIDYQDAMLSWPSGPRDTDGVWGTHWYESVWASTGFVLSDSAADPDDDASSAGAILDVAVPIYEQLRAYRLVTADLRD